MGKNNPDYGKMFYKFSITNEMNVSFIATVFNEEKSILGFLDSLLSQKKVPSEIIIVDGGSKDRTVSLIKNYAKKFSEVTLMVMVKKGNRSIGRNFAIKKTRWDIIAVSDAGCFFDKNWFDHITSPFQNQKVDVVAGFYKPITRNVFEKCLATYTCFPEDKLNNDFLPSSRSIAFRKFAWESVNGYPEYLDTCEDLVFAKNLKGEGINFYIAKKAIVLWPQRKNILEAAKQFYNYAVGDGKAGYFRYQTPFLFGRYLVVLSLFLIILHKSKYEYLLLFAVFFLIYLIWAVEKNYKYVNKFKAILYIPILQIVSDLCVLSGMTYGLAQRYYYFLNKKRTL